MTHPFSDLFTQWSASYDRTVYATAGEYAEVFNGYQRILEMAAWQIPQDVEGIVVDIGSGTGNLTLEISRRNYQVLGIDPVQAMLNIAKRKYANLHFIQGDFLHLNLPEDLQVRAFTSSYALHHLTDQQKSEAIGLLASYLSSGGKVIIADTFFESLDEKARSIL